MEREREREREREVVLECEIDSLRSRMNEIRVRSIKERLVMFQMGLGQKREREKERKIVRIMNLNVIRHPFHSTTQQLGEAMVLWLGEAIIRS